MSGDPQVTVDFYAGLLGLRLVKQTVNFDDPGTYHLYFGDDTGRPGSLMTFFPWTSNGVKGRIGTGQVGTTAFSIPRGSVDYWMSRLKGAGVTFSGPFDRFAEEGIAFDDPDGLHLELIATDQTADQSNTPPNRVIPEAHAIRGFYSVALWVEGYERTAGLMTEALGFRRTEEKGSRFRYVVGEGGPARTVDIICQPDLRLGSIGVGTVHHIAWRAADDNAQMALRNDLVARKVNVTPVLNRQYFKSIYFREPGHVLFEIATDPPGMLIDESRESLGTALKLPPWLESERTALTGNLVPLRLPEEAH
jgi:glyoxalase family protein